MQEILEAATQSLSTLAAQVNEPQETAPLETSVSESQETKQKESPWH